MCASRLAESLGRVDSQCTQRQQELFQAFGLPTEPLDLDPEESLRLMWHDKKVSDGQIVFVLPTCIGEVELVRDVPSNEVIRVLKFG